MMRRGRNIARRFLGTHACFLHQHFRPFHISRLPRRAIWLAASDLHFAAAPAPLSIDIILRSRRRGVSHIDHGDGGAPRISRRTSRGEAGSRPSTDARARQAQLTISESDDAASIFASAGALI